MQTLEANVQALYRAQRRGASMAMAIAASFLLFTLGILSIHSASRLLSAAEDKRAREQCRALAISFADVVQGELERGDTALCAYVEEQLSSGTSAHAVSEGREETIYLTVRLGEELPKALPAGSFLPGETETYLKEVDEIAVPCRSFVLETTVIFRGQRYTCQDPYLWAERYRAEYTSAGEPVFYQGGWQRFDGTELQDTEPISYFYDERALQGHCFLPGWDGT